jgi:hypothetical protein
MSLVPAFLPQGSFPQVDEVAMPRKQEPVEMNVERIVYVGSKSR